MIGKFLQQRRVARGLTQEYVANRLNISRQAVSNWEKGTRQINITDLIAYAKILEISFEDLEVHINHFTKLESEEYKTSSASTRILPEHFNLELRKSNSNHKKIKHIKIEGDKVVGVHILLTSLLFGNKELVIKNCPSALDFLNILYEFGSSGWMDAKTSKDKLKLTTQDIPYDITTLNRISRASIGVISALTYKYHKLLFTFPGGDDFCDRPINLHLDILSTISTYQYDAIDNCYYSERNDLLNKNISLNCYAMGSKSVGAFFNAISLAYVYPNEIMINGISPDPTISYLVSLLESATNRSVEYVTSDKIRIPKVEEIEIKDAEIVLPPDMSVLVSYVLLLWNSLDDVVFLNVEKKDIPESYLWFFNKLGLSVVDRGNSLSFLKKKQMDKEYFEFLRLGAVPFISTDLGPIISEFLASRNISSILFDEIFISRASHISELSKLGINLKVLDNGALKTLRRTQILEIQEKTFDLKDIRAGMAILMGINQNKVTYPINLRKFDQVLRGYGNVKEVLEMIGYEVEIYGET